MELQNSRYEKKVVEKTIVG